MISRYFGEKVVDIMIRDETSMIKLSKIQTGGRYDTISGFNSVRGEALDSKSSSYCEGLFLRLVAGVKTVRQCLSRC